MIFSLKHEQKTLKNCLKLDDSETREKTLAFDFYQSFIG